MALVGFIRWFLSDNVAVEDMDYLVRSLDWKRPSNTTPDSQGALNSSIVMGTGPREVFTALIKIPSGFPQIFYLHRLFWCTGSHCCVLVLLVW